MFFIRYTAAVLAVLAFAFPLSAQYRGVGPDRKTVTTKASLQYIQNLVGNLLQQVKNLQDENARLAEEVQKLSSQVQRLQAGAGKNAEDLEKIRVRCAAETETNRLHIKRLEKLVKDLAGTMAKPSQVSSPVPRERTRLKRAFTSRQSGDFVEHTVEKGHVLYHIARAYNVTVREIKQANNLKNDNLYVGQKLLIPVKKK